MRAMISLCLVAALAVLSSCSLHSGSEPLEIRTVTFLERTSNGYDSVYWFPDEDCEVRVGHGPNMNEIECAPTRHCSEEELAQGEALLSYEAWHKYPNVPFTTTPLEDSGTGEKSGLEVTFDYAVGTIKVEQPGFPAEYTKHFQAGTTGPEAEVIEYFRGLAKKYGAK